MLRALADLCIADGRGQGECPVVSVACVLINCADAILCLGATAAQNPVLSKSAMSCLANLFSEAV